MTRYRTLKVDDLEIFYREAGPPNAPALLLLHGFPSSSRMYEPLLRRLADRWRLIAPDYPGFGHSSAPTPTEFAYTFDHLAEVMNGFVDALGIERHTLLVQDYGGPVGFRMAMAHPERLEALIVQNAVVHESGLGPLWETRHAFWADRAAHEPELRENFFSLAATRGRHLGNDPATDRYDPDLWTDEFAFLNRPGQADIQVDLFYDYRTTSPPTRPGSSGCAGTSPARWCSGGGTTRRSRYRKPPRTRPICPMRRSICSMAATSSWTPAPTRPPSISGHS
ncbi:alpha/beta fold hydrolase [Streptomyces sp. NPDC060065]|uniref:alpha/beta fold hydrolase n=1 Tax=Streptomyces sp. NPDC060065 TaxID=3347050 RepID=UPI0036B43DFF